MLGKEILGYHVDEKIGSGGFGTVYKVSKTNVTGTYVRALKHIEVPTKRQYVNILNSMGGDSTKADDYFANILKNIVGEIKILSALSESGNQNIVRYYENDVIETHSPKKYDIYILMEYLTPFPEYLDNTSLTVKDVIKLGKDILNALIACHGRNIIHRDIKDDNIFVASDGTYKIGDFGVSKALKDQSRAASIKGTPNFIAPEVYLGKDNYDHTVDIYSLGIVLYRLLNNSRNPFLPEFPNAYTSEDEDIAFEARMTGKIPELPNMAKNELGEAVLKAIKSRNERYNTAKEFLDALEKAEKTLAPIYLAQGIGIFNASQESEETVAFSNVDADVTIAVSMASGQAEVQNNGDDKDLFKTIGLFSDDVDVNQKETEQQEETEEQEEYVQQEDVHQEEFAEQDEDANKTIALENYDLVGNAQSVESDNTDEEDNAPDKENLDSPFVEPPNKIDIVENKQKNKKRFLPLILIVGIVLIVILLVTFILIGMLRENAVSKVDFKTLNIVGTNAYGSVSNSVTTFSFVDEIGDKTLKKYKLSKNDNGAEPLVSGVVDLTIGDNYFYLFESGKNGDRLYTINIRRKPTYNIVFNIDDDHKVSSALEEGALIVPPESPKKEGYDFIGWNYDFAVPVSRDIVITPMWDLKEFTVSWRECKNATIIVKRISSYNSSATKGFLSVDDTIYCGDTLRIYYEADEGFSLSDKGIAYVKVVDNVTSSDIYATVEPISYKVTWSNAVGCSIVVKRTSSPYANAPKGNISSGSNIYHGDVLSIDYTANTGFSLSSKGLTTITVDGNVTSSSIYASSTPNAYSVTWSAPTGCSIIVKRTSSPYALASTGALSNGGAIYYGDVLSVEYAANNGFTLSGKGVTSITVSGNVTSSNIYANVKPNSYAATWSTPTGCSITVKRTSSPYALASTGALSNGSAIYYGDVLSVEYAANDGYSITNSGKTSIVVSSNVTSADIYAIVTANNYTYNIVYKSSNGTLLGTSTATYKYGTTNTISPQTFSGYDTPASQSVIWNDVSGKTIEFIYSPQAVDTSQAIASGAVWIEKGKTAMTYSVEAEYRNRTSTSVEIRVKWTNTLKSSYYTPCAYYFKTTIGGVASDDNQKIVVVSANSNWKTASSVDRTKYTYSEWVTVTLNTTEKIQVSINGTFWDTSSDGAPQAWSGICQISSY